MKEASSLNLLPKYKTLFLVEGYNCDTVSVSEQVMVLDNHSIFRSKDYYP